MSTRRAPAAPPPVSERRHARARGLERAGGDVARQTRYLHPGQLVIAEEPTAITTILGSCVSVCLFDGRRRVGGVNHFLLPNWVGHGPSSTRFGNVAVERLIERMLAAGCASFDLEARLFGGSHLLPGAGTEPSLGAGLGARNVEVARTLLQSARIAIVSEDVGGRLGRKLTFFSDDGSCRVKTLQQSQPAPGRTSHTP